MSNRCTKYHRAGTAASRGSPSEVVPHAPASDFGVSATPDHGVRRSRDLPWDESTRPAYAVPQSDRDYTAHQQAVAQHLVDVHDHLRAELTQLLQVIDQVAAGAVDVGHARSLINTMTMRQNN